ncbi:hypothetical protein AnigIFM63309_003157 [Aspergillus niger]|nr:hypothetical protein AnigIFM63309_003157 [Aspergillus niger]
MVSEKPVIVIIGASLAGIPTAHSLLEDINYKVILINSSPTLYHTVAGPRIMAKPTHSTRKITSSESDQLLFGTLIKNAQDAITSASSIVIGGAGPIGVELAGEIAEALEQRGEPMGITIVSAWHRALPTLKKSASKAVESLLAQKNCNMSTDNKIWDITLDSAHQITADLNIPTTGVVPNNSFIPREWLDDGGWVKSELRGLVNHDEQHPIYAAGHISNSMRLAIKAAEHAAVLATNKNDIC